MSYNPQYPAFVAGRCKDGADIKTSVTGDQLHLLHMALGVAGEVGELIQAVHNEDERNVKEEIGDLYFFLQGLANGAHLDWHPQDIKSGMSIRTLEDISVFSGEIVDAVKKYAIYQKPLSLTDLSYAMSGIETAICSVAHHFGFTLHQCISDNVEKLTKRYHSGRYSDQQAQGRADK